MQIFSKDEDIYLARMKKTTFLLLIWLMGACSTPSPSSLSPSSISPPPMVNPEMAQITVQQKFRLLGGGSGNVYSLFDIGSSIEYNAEMPPSGERHPNSDHYLYKHKITMDLFDKVGIGNFIGTISFSNDNNELKNLLEPEYWRLHGQVADYDPQFERIDQSLLGATLVKYIDVNYGGTKANLPYRGNEPRGKLQSVRLRRLVDIKGATLYRTLRRSENKCPAENSSGASSAEIQEFFNEAFKEDGFKVNPEGFYIYSEICGLLASFEHQWNANFIGTFPGFETLTWERPPGRLALIGTIGGQRTYANEISVEAGKRYVGVYDPNNFLFVVEALE